MLTGSYPFEGGSEDEIFDMIRQYAQQLPNCISLLKQADHSEEVIDLVINGFLSDSKTRLGKELKRIQNHDFFKDFDWDKMMEMSPDIEILMILKSENLEMNITIDLPSFNSRRRPLSKTVLILTQTALNSNFILSFPD